MDIHIIPDITADKLKKIHIADPELQNRYNVMYHQFWLNEEAGTVFLLIEGPDKESCARVHREVYGDLACQIVEMENDFCRLVMGDTIQSSHVLGRHHTGKTDKFYRFVVAVDIAGRGTPEETGNSQKILLSEKPKKIVHRIITSYNGRVIRRPEEDRIIAVFTDAEDAVACAVEIQIEGRKRRNLSVDDNRELTFKIGISGAQWDSEVDDFFDQAIRPALRLSLVADHNKIVASSLVRRVSGMADMISSQSSVKAIHRTDEQFLIKLFDLIEKNLSDNRFNLKQICRSLGISRPQLYRKITAISGRSPNHFIRDIKMKRALSLIRRRELNVSEVALEVGYNNASYFSKCFREAYGVAPSRVSAR